MKAAAVILFLVAGFAATNALPLGDLVSGLCPEIQAALPDLSILTTAVNAASQADVELPPGIPIVVGPTDAAFELALSQLNMTPEELLANTALLKSVLDLHLAGGELASDVADTVGGTTLDFTVDGEPVTLEEFLAFSGEKAIDTGAQIIPISAAVACPDSSAIALVADQVILPAAPGPAPGPMPGPMNITIGQLVANACGPIQTVLQDANYTNLAGLLRREDVANTIITLPPGEVIIAAPNNAAFDKTLANVGPDFSISNLTTAIAILSNHIAVAANTDQAYAMGVNGKEMRFWRSMPLMADMPATIASLVEDTDGGVITDNDSLERANIEGVITCPANGQIAFAIDAVLLPEEYEKAPSPAPAPTPAPSPAPSAATGFTFGVAAAVMAVAALAA